MSPDMTPRGPSKRNVTSQTASGIEVTLPDGSRSVRDGVSSRRVVLVGVNTDDRLAAMASTFLPRWLAVKRLTTVAPPPSR